VAYASTQGYPTLAIDRLGNGLSDHPDPILVVQNPIHVEIANAIIQLARKGVSPLPHAFNKIIYVGHSIGSLIGNALNAQYPTAVDATILTGFSDNYLSGAIAVLPPCLPLPAQLVQPTRYANLAVCYLEFSSEAGDAAALFYPGGYDPSLQAFDYATRGTVTCGELLTIVSTLTEAPKYEVPIFVVTGQNDGVFCNPWSSIIAANCGTGSTSMLAQTQSLYPAASSYGWYAVPDSGHCWQLHYAAQQGFNASHTWLAEEGF
jgi:pimeloyl-ACP methyl ester carboxylesterase